MKVLYNMIQEALTNAIKHSKCSEVLVSITHRLDIIRTTIIDNGDGCKSFNTGFGLTVMGERIQALGGTLEISCIKGEGFTVISKLPVSLKRVDE